MPFKTRKSKKSVIRRKPAKKSTSNKSLVALIKKVSLRPVETKHTHHIDENLQLYHNTPYYVYDNLMTTQSIADNNSGTANFACRVGDEVIARGLSYKFWFANKLDRPNVMYKIVFYEIRNQTVPSGGAPYSSQGATNYMIRDLDTEKYRILKTVKFNLQTASQKVIDSQGTFNGAEGHKAVSVWIPLKNKRIKYENGSSVPRFTDIAFTVVCYDSFGTLLTDNIASFAICRKFYFKDP